MKENLLISCLGVHHGESSPVRSAKSAVTDKEEGRGIEPINCILCGAQVKDGEKCVSSSSSRQSGTLYCKLGSNDSERSKNSDWSVVKYPGHWKISFMLRPVVLVRDVGLVRRSILPRGPVYRVVWLSKFLYVHISYQICSFTNM